MQKTKLLTTKSIIECLLRLDEFMKLPVAIRIAFKKYLISGHQTRIGDKKVIELSPEEKQSLKEYLEKYMPAIRLNLEQIINVLIVEHEQIRQTKKTIGEITYDDLISLFIRFSRLDDCKSILPIPLNI